MGRKVFVVGVGMTKFERPGRRDWHTPEMVREAAGAALTDARIPYERVEQAVCSYVSGESTSGQRAVYELGLTGIPVYNVNNNCASGSTALFLAKQLVEGGLSDVVLAVGFERMASGSIALAAEDEAPLGPFIQLMEKVRGTTDAPMAAQMFGNAGREHAERYGTTAEQFAMVGWKNHKHSVDNPYAQFQAAYTLEEVLASRPIFEPLTLLQCSPTSEGSAAAMVVSEAIVREFGLDDQAVEIIGQAMATDTPSTFDGSMITMVGADMTRLAAHRVYEQSGYGPEDVQVIELHDCFSTNEIITTEGLGLCPEGRGGELVASGATTYGGRWVVNPSGGLISKGHPLGATGLAQCAELNWQLRGMAGRRQVPGARRALQHNLGLGGAAVITMYEKTSPQ